MSDPEFRDFDLIKPIYRALRDMEYTIPTPVQLQSIPPLLSGRDLLGCAQTGTGKTAAFSLPIIQNLAKNYRTRQRGFVRALIVTPTRELAAQIYENLNMYSKYVDVTSIVVFGGVKQHSQVKSLNKGIDILVATPGRLLDLIGQGYIKLDRVEYFVLDEADRMLDMGFIPDVRRILKYLPNKRQTMFFSATLPPKIIQLSKTMIQNPVRVDVTPDKPVVELIDQQLIHVKTKQEKVTVLMNILKEDNVKKALVFTRTKHGANKLVKLIARADIEALAIHGNKTQSARQNALDSFKAGRVKVLIATDIAARGIDVSGISHVINHDIPNIPDTYIHRIGRTARAGSGGTSISLCSPEEKEFIKDIEKLTKQKIPTIDKKPYLTKVELKPVEKKQYVQNQSRNKNNQKPRNPRSQNRRKHKGQASPGSKMRKGNHSR